MVSLQCITISLFYNSDKDKEFLFNFRQQCEAFINTDMRCFKIQTRDMGQRIEMFLFLTSNIAAMMSHAN